MLDEAVEDWRCGELIVVPHAWRDDELWFQIQASARDRITTNLQAMYSELLQQPLSGPLLDMAQQVKLRLA